MYSALWKFSVELLRISMLDSCLFLHSLIPQLDPQIYRREILVALGLFCMEIFTIHVNKFWIVNRIYLLAVGHSCPSLFFTLLFSKSVSCKVRNVSILNGFFPI